MESKGFCVLIAAEINASILKWCKSMLLDFWNFLSTGIGGSVGNFHFECGFRLV